ncbi:MocR-like pyridoxine biosynthesis transcription factor PdxR [Enterobacillus tribolii]|uniref:GntR family transcriptional regulator/MocR family aminotransferase n=1 Tax=Enterobacillus tribolii TaxID=1487935 RepID=A0A370R353_9GAMM|nr:PLP-dependent aminotransferase family protein [Enterobacillus tribolii]MBW7983925.1 PLP-dependent aminotransferase family protein [Enterobacillus tribolii]RDK96862.1 GntR family transcriptional regulator/MocR family aminotransferase [Enterobacillus tribolii]
MLSFNLDRSHPLSLQKQIYQQIHTALHNGELTTGERLPSIRELGARLQVSRNTITAVYEKLVQEGFIASRPGVGYNVIFSSHVEATRNGAAQAELAHPPVPLRTQAPDTYIDVSCPMFFSLGNPDESAFPWQRWRSWNNKASHSKHLLMTRYHPPAGLLSLRQELVKYLANARGIHTDAGHIIITNGVQEGLALLAQLLLTPQEHMTIESPCYSGAWNLFSICTPHLHSIPVDDEGLRTDLLPEQRCALAYVTPSHQYPVGGTLPLERRHALLAWSQRSNAYVIEDDYDTTFLYGSQPLPALKSLENANNVIYLSSFSKTLGPGMRIGFMVCPDRLVEPLLNLKALWNHGASWLYQQFLADFMHDQGYHRHLRRLELEYASRQALLREGLQAIFPGSSLLGTSSGLHLTLKTTLNARQADTLRLRCMQRGVRFETLDSICNGSERAYQQQNATPMLLFGFSALPAAHIRQALKIIAETARDMGIN